MCRGRTPTPVGWGSTTRQPVEPGQPGRDPGGAEAQGRLRVVHVICTVQRHLDRGAHCARRVGWTRSARTLLSHATWAACGQRLAVPADFGSSLAAFNGGWNGGTKSLVTANYSGGQSGWSPIARPCNRFRFMRLHIIPIRACDNLVGSAARSPSVAHRIVKTARAAVGVAGMGSREGWLPGNRA